MMSPRFNHPTLLIDEQKCRANIVRMISKATRNGAKLRPHFKTHQSAAIGEWFKAYGVDRICVSSLRMAVYFAKAGWSDITVAFPFNIHEMALANSLAQYSKLHLLIASPDSMQFLAAHCEQEMGFYIEIDTGYGRTGIATTDQAQIDAVLAIASNSDWLHFRGFLAHPGHSYDSRDGKGIDAIHQAAMEQLLSLKKHYQNTYPHIELSLGDTPCCSTIQDYAGIDEMRPGNFVFYDLTQAAIGSCTIDDIAVAMHCPVVACYPERQEVVIYGGGVHFSKDRLKLLDNRIIYGQVVTLKNKGWMANLNDVFVTKLSQEHGTVYGPPDYIGSLQVGDWITILPVHSCMTANLQSAYHDLGGKQYSIMGKLV